MKKQSLKQAEHAGRRARPVHMTGSITIPRSMADALSAAFPNPQAELEARVRLLRARVVQGSDVQVSGVALAALDELCRLAKGAQP